MPSLAAPSGISDVTRSSRAHAGAGDTPLLPIHEIQGTSERSPLEGQSVATEGVITGVQLLARQPGFFLQQRTDEGPTGASRALFVETSAVLDDARAGALRVGVPVRVMGQVSEEPGFTTIEAGPDAVEPLRASPLPVAERPRPVRLELPADPAERDAVLAPLQSMVVEVGDPLVLSPTNRFGDVVVADASRLGMRRVADPAETGHLIHVSPRLGRPTDLGTGDRPERIVGPLQHAFGRHMVLQVGTLGSIVRGPQAPRRWGDVTGDGRVGREDVAIIEGRVGTPASGPLDPADLDADGLVTAADVELARTRMERAAATGEPAFTVASFNMQNFFDPRDPDGRGNRPSPRQHELRLSKFAATIRDELGAPDILALQEVENDAVLADLVARPELAALGYRHAMLPGPDRRGSHLAMLWREGRVSLEDLRQEQRWLDRNGDPLPDCADGPTDRRAVHPRPPLVADLTIHDVESGATAGLSMVVNHFTSKFSPSGAPTEPRRIAQAEHVASIVDGIQARSPGRDVLVIGDLNDREESRPLAVLTGPDDARRMVNVIAEHVPPAERYSFNYNGLTEQIDHVLATPDLALRTADAGIAHLNTDVPAAVGSLPGPRGSSDHEVPWARFLLPDAAAGIAQVE